MRKPRKGVNFIPKDLPLEEDGSIAFEQITRLDEKASRLLLAEVRAAIKGRASPGNFRSPDGTDPFRYSMTPEGRLRFAKWKRESSVYVALSLLQGNLDQFQLTAIRKGLAKARSKAVETNRKVTPALIERYRQEEKRTTSQKQLGDRIGVSQPTLRKIQDQLGVLRKK